jgi:predicted DNA-binding protein (MmcQ/YjbR family)
MNLETLRLYCLKKEDSSEDFPFDEETLVFRVRGKIFALTGIYDRPLTVNLKCDPEFAIELRERHDEVKAGRHMNKKHWNTVTIDGTLSTKEIFSMIDHSYDLVKQRASKPKRKKPDKKDKRIRHIIP